MTAEEVPPTTQDDGAQEGPREEPAPSEPVTQEASEMPEASFVHLHVHTQYSVADATTRISDIVATCKRQGMRSVAMTDHDNLYGAVEFYKACKAEGIKPILGAAMSIAEGPLGEPVLHHYQVNLLAMNHEGYLNLLYLISQAHLRAPDGLDEPRINHELLREHSAGLICLTGNLSGEIPMALLRDQPRAAHKALRRYKDIFGDRLYIECQMTRFIEHRKLFPQLVELGERFDVPCVASNDVHYLTPEDARAHEVLVAIGLQINAREDADWIPCTDFNFASPDEMMERFHGHEELCLRTLEIAERCNVELRLGKPVLPTYEVSERVEPSEPLRRAALSALAKRSDVLNQEHADFDPEQFAAALDEQLLQVGYLEKLCQQGLQKRLSHLRAMGTAQDEQIYQARLKVELEVIVGMDFPGYFLIVWDFIRWSKDNHIPVGPGRGSGAGSLVAYCLDITDLDPLAYGLLFERFLNPERVSMPDFDIDFCIDRRSEVIEYVADKYGHTQVGQIVTFGTLKAKAALKDCGRVLEVDLAKVNGLTKLIPDDCESHAKEQSKKNKAVGLPPMSSLEAAMVIEPKLAYEVKQDQQVANLMETAIKVEGGIRQTGIHAAGVVISKGPLWHFAPVARGPKGENVAMFAKEPVEEAGLVKFDFLGLKNLTMIDHAMRLIHQAQREAGSNGEANLELFDLSRVAIDDPKSYAIIGEGKTAGIFQMESSGFTEMMCQMRPSEFADIIAAGALYRPGPMGSDMHGKYIRRKHKQEEVTFEHPMLEPILQETYGAMVYQEQVMQIARDIGGYTLGGADLLRRAMGKKKTEEMQKHRQIFSEGAKKQGLEEHQALAIFDQMAEFANYGFNKSHAAAYGLITYHTAYLKAHFPAQFFAALLTADKDNTASVVGYIQAAEKEAGLKVLPPDINLSELSFSVVDGQIRFGLGAIRNVGAGAVESLLQARRESGPFKNLFELCRRMDLGHINKRVLQALARCGALDGLIETSGAMTLERLGTVRATLEQNIEVAIRRAHEENNDQGFLFSEDDSYMPCSEPWSERQVLDGEREVLGLYVSGHPVLLYGSQLARLGCRPLGKISVAQIPPQQNRMMVPCAAMIVDHRIIRTQRGTEMAFVTLEDPSARVEVICIGKGLDQCREFLAYKSPVLVQVAASRDRNDPELMRMRLESIVPMDRALSGSDQRLYIRLPEQSCSPKKLRKVSAYLELFARWTRSYNQAVRDKQAPPPVPGHQPLPDGGEEGGSEGDNGAEQHDLFSLQGQALAGPTGDDPTTAVVYQVGAAPTPSSQEESSPLLHTVPVMLEVHVEDLGFAWMRANDDRYRTYPHDALLKLLSQEVGPGRVQVK